MKRVFLYVRVSTQEQAVDGYSIGEQIDRLTNYCNSFGWTIMHTYIDAGYSGGNLNRPALQDMLNEIRSHVCDAVVVYKLDRLSRSQKDTLELIEDCFLANNVDFISMSENFDTGTPFGRAMIGILAVFAQLEREQIKERMSLGREGRAKEGKFHGGGYIPIGYDYVDGELVVNEFEAMQIREIHSLFQSGYKLRTINNLFLDKGYTHKYGRWHHKRIKEALLNDLYIGNVHFNNQTYKGSHPAIIDEETFNKSIRLYESVDRSSYRNHGRTTYLGGLLFCKKCGARMALSIYNDKKTGRTYKYYCCHSRRKQNRNMVKDASCKNKIWKMEELDALVFGEIRKLALDASVIHEIDSGTDDRERIILAEITRIDEQRGRYLELYGTGIFTIEEIQSKIKPLEEKKKKLEAEIKKASGITAQEAYEMIADFDGIIKHGSFEEIRLMVNALIERIEIDDEDVYIHWKF